MGGSFILYLTLHATNGSIILLLFVLVELTIKKRKEQKTTKKHASTEYYSVALPPNKNMCVYV